MWLFLNLRRMELAELMKLEPDSIHVIPNGVDMDTLLSNWNRKRKHLAEQINLLDAAPILLLPVRVTPRKNIELALHTLKELRKQFPQGRARGDRSAGAA